MQDEPDDQDEVLLRLRSGDAEDLAELFNVYRARLKRMVWLRLDAQLQSRVDASDVLQDAYLDAAKRVSQYLESPTIPFFLWLRLITGQRIATLHRYHIGTKMRSARKEVSLYRGAMPQASSATLAAHMLGRLTSPSHAALRAEMQLQVQEKLNGMDEMDREIISLRHFEELTNTEVAQVLGLTKTAASNRYVRALKRLRSELSSYPELLDGRFGGS